jgi:hypothetical protein
MRDRPLLPVRRCHEGWVGKEQQCSFSSKYDLFFFFLFNQFSHAT